MKIVSPPGPLDGTPATVNVLLTPGSKAATVSEIFQHIERRNIINHGGHVGPGQRRVLHNIQLAFGGNNQR